MTTAEIRKAFLEYFNGRGHTIVESSSLVPAGDPTLLFTNAGMVQFKDTFLGTEQRAYRRATTCQKCLRISGKHNDLENVGRTARHHTFFEMLGNFSFGDYFKQDAIEFAWEFVTKVLSLPKDRLWVTVFEDDDEAAALWSNRTDVLPGRILRCGMKDNFWAMGDTGPCGPCSEIFYYLGDNPENQSEAEFRLDDGTYIEIWNLVFMQFNRDAQGNLAPLPKPSVDTGMGLERVAAVVQGKRANYDSDLLRAIISSVERLSEKRYDGRDYAARTAEEDPQYPLDVAMRVIADHVRAASFLIADGINPSSEGRGYVLRRLVRRACRHGRVLGFREAFLFKVASELVSLMGEVYPELRRNREKIEKLIRIEEEKFIGTLDTGLSLLKRAVAEVKARGAKSLPGEAAFELHDTYGFPLDLTEDLVRSEGLAVDHDGFAREMERQRERSRASRASETALILQRSVRQVPTVFRGYEFPEYESVVLGLFDKDGELERAVEGQEVALVAAETPFYAESGGQVGDTGSISSATGSMDVVDTLRVGSETTVHIARVTEGEIVRGSAIRLAIDSARREKLRANHSATHLLHLALREVLGDHVKQAGSRVADGTLRFDFTHFEPVSADQMAEIELRVNQLVRENYEVQTEVLPIEDAKRTGAIALFGEKYGETVRVVQVCPQSREFCGGTHVGRTGDIGVMVLLSEGAISSGVRRIEASAGAPAFAEVLRERRLLRELTSLLGANQEQVRDRLEKVLESNRAAERELERVSQKLSQDKSSELTRNAVVRPDGRKIVAGRVDNVNARQLRELADDLRGRLGSGLIALAGVADGKAVLLTAVTPDLVDRYHAGDLMKHVAEVVGGRGGGKPDLAQAGGGDPAMIDQALRRFEELVS